MASRRAALRLLSRFVSTQQAVTPVALLRPVCFHATALGSEAHSPPGAALSAAQVERKKTVNSLLYRAKQRGFLELDIIVGGWAERNLPGLSDAELASFGEVLDVENPDLFKWLTGQSETPEQLARNPTAVKIKAQVQQSLSEHAKRETRGKLGAPWVRGWSDSGLPSSGNQQ